MRYKRLQQFIPAGLVLLTLAAFSRTLWNGFVFDDAFYFLESNHVPLKLNVGSILWSFTHTYGGNWQPLTNISHILDLSLFGLDPLGHHLMNTIFHAVTAACLFLALIKLTGYLWRSALTAALFAVHPLRVESVAWVAERKDVLSGLFFMLCLLAYVRYVRKPGTARYLVVAAIFSLGLMAKPMLVTLPALLLLIDYWPLGRLSPSKASGGLLRLTAEKMPLLILSVASAIVTMSAQKSWGALKTLDSYPLWIRLGNAAVSTGRYLEKAAWPFNLSIFYPHPGWTLSARLAFTAAILYTLVTLFALATAGRHPYFIFGW
jgi:hypothetical protein